MRDAMSFSICRLSAISAREPDLIPEDASSKKNEMSARAVSDSISVEDRNKMNL